MTEETPTTETVESDAADTPTDPEPYPESQPAVQGQGNGNTLAALTDTDPDDPRELSKVQRLYVDHAAGRLTDREALRGILAFAAGCDEDVYADEAENG